MESLVVVLLVVIAGLIGWLIRIANQILASLERNAEFQGIQPRARQPYHTCHGYGNMTNYSTWRFSEKGWHLVEQKLDKDNFELGEPPRRPGAYVGEIVRRPAVRKGER
jgi:hypothetical protein